jgi:hypothetical protein
MADVERGERGQLLIVSAIGLAILLTALALALNTAAFAGAHVAATDNSLHERQAAIQYQESVERAVADLMVLNNTTEGGLRADVETWDELTMAQYLHDSAVTDASLVNATVENRIVQDETRTFTDQSGAADWIVAENASASQPGTVSQAPTSQPSIRVKLVWNSSANASVIIAK